MESLSLARPMLNGDRRRRRATDADREGTTILVADAYAAARAGIQIAVEPHGFEVVAKAGDAASAVAAARRTRPRLCLIATELPGGGLEATRAIAKELPGTALVVLDEGGSEDQLMAAIDAGASGYLPRADALDRLPDALNAALEAYVMLPLSLLNSVIEYAAPPGGGVLAAPGAPPVRLTRREHQVLRALLDGASTAGIAESLGVAPVTVRRYVSDILRKAGVGDRAQLRALWARRNGA